MASVKSQLPMGRDAELLQMVGGWALVKVNADQGWVRASALAMPGAQVGSAAAGETGRRATGNSAVPLGIRALPPRSNRHALIIAIGEYKKDSARPVDSLQGVKHDVGSALQMAQYFQVPAENITLLRDAAATRAGVAEALRELESRVQPGDRVFVYWSGHGSRYFDAAAGGCVETLVPYDLQDINNRQFAEWLKPLGAKADKMLVMYDACHSGTGNIPSARSRSLGAQLKPKFSGASDECQRPSNVRDRGLQAAVSALGLASGDVVHIASSRPDEISFDNAQTGGLATQAFRRCLLDESVGQVTTPASVDQLAACAQAKVNAQFRGVSNITAPNITLSGNREFVPAWFANSATIAPTPGTPMAEGKPHATSSVLDQVMSPPNQPPSTWVVARPPRPSAAPLEDVMSQIHAQRDTKRKVSVTTASDRLAIGVDSLDFAVTSNEPGYVYVAMLGSDRQSLYLLFPNELDQANRIERNTTMLLPRDKWRLKASGPAGTDQLLVMVADGPRDLTSLRGGRAGPFSKPLTDSQGLARLQWLLGTSVSSGANCRVDAGLKKDAVCSDAFGSALVTVQEH